MAKIYGLFGAMTGKLADTVMAVRNGEQIARKYQPVVYNPSSPAQVAQRAKMKLLSQLSAVLAPVIAIPKQGAVSSRNLFTKRNFPLTSFSDDTASITLADVQLTSSAMGLPAFTASRTGQAVAVQLSMADFRLTRLVYVICLKNPDNTLRYFTSRVVNQDNTGLFQTTLDIPHSASVIWAYGMRDNTEAARVAFGDLETDAAETVGKIITNRILTESDVTLTETRGLEVADSRDVDPEKEGSKKK